MKKGYVCVKGSMSPHDRAQRIAHHESHMNTAKVLAHSDMYEKPGKGKSKEIGHYMPSHDEKGSAKHMSMIHSKAKNRHSY